MAELFGERVHELRKRSRLTVREVAHRADVSESAIRHIESGSSKHASLLVGLRLARLFEVSPWYLATGSDTPSEAGSASEAHLAKAVEQLSIRVSALDGRVSSLEDDRRDGGRHRGTAPGDVPSAAAPPG